MRDERRAGVLLIDHNVPLVLGVCDRIHVLDQGITLAEGTPAEIRSHPAVTEAFGRISSHRLVEISRLYDARAESLSDGGSASVPEALLGASFWRRQEGSARC